jgi:hypothetical protein
LIEKEQMRNILFGLIWSGFVFSASIAEVDQILKKHQNVLTLSRRIELFSKDFLGLPYGFGGPLGEGPQGRYDQDPLYRFDSFDCTTYVETVFSLSLAQTPNEFEFMMNKIRYEDGEIDYLKRNHFPSLQWIPFNVQNGLLKEINHLIVSKTEQKLAEATIDLPNWLTHIKIEELKLPLLSESEKEVRLEELHGLHVFFTPQVAKLNNKSIDTLVNNPKLLKKIPHGALVNFVRPNWDLRETIGTHMNVSHQGLIFQIRGKTWLRHASSGGQKIVTDVLFLDYIEKYINHPTLKGVQFMSLED